MSPSSASTFPVTDRTTIGRIPERGTRDRALIESVLDEGMVCHVGLTTDHGPVVIPTTYARVGDALVLHGSPAATWLRQAGKGTPLCVTVTLVDGLVLARSAFHHSMNYRSVVVFGTATPITDRDEKIAALDALVEHLVPGRLPEVRPMHPEEIAQTLVLRLPLEEASMKARAGGPNDDEDDLTSGAWAGVIPMTTTFGAAITHEQVRPGTEVPPSATGYRRPGTPA